MSTDKLTHGNHFNDDLFTAYDIGWKSAAANISDICAMGGEPLYLLVALSLPADISDDWIRDFYRGLKDCSKEHGGVAVIGGDLCSAEQIDIAITVVGQANPAGAIMRSTAKPGYKVGVSGKFGNSKNFLDKYQALLANNSSSFKQDLQSLIDQNKNDYEKLIRPCPRYDLVKNIWTSVNSAEHAAMIDSSDGLAASLFEIAEQSEIQICIDFGLLAKDSNISLDNALYGGEEYELVLCCENLPKGFQEIGHVQSGKGLLNLRNNELLTKDKIYKHFEN